MWMPSLIMGVFMKFFLIMFFTIIFISTPVLSHQNINQSNSLPQNLTSTNLTNQEAIKKPPGVWLFIIINNVVKKFGSGVVVCRDKVITSPHVLQFDVEKEDLDIVKRTLLIDLVVFQDPYIIIHNQVFHFNDIKTANNNGLKFVYLNLNKKLDNTPKLYSNAVLPDVNKFYIRTNLFFEKSNFWSFEKSDIVYGTNFYYAIKTKKLPWLQPGVSGSGLYHYQDNIWWVDGLFAYIVQKDLIDENEQDKTMLVVFERNFLTCEDF